MSPNSNKTYSPSKKHLARMEREKQQIRWIWIISIIVFALVAGLIIGGIINEKVIKPNRAVAEVNGEKISMKYFQEQVRFSRSRIIDNANQTYQFMQYFAEDPTYLSSFISQLQQIVVQLTPINVGQETLDNLIEGRLIQQEAKRRNISVTEEDVAKEFQNLLGYYPEGTPTPAPTLDIIPTPTLNSLQLTASAPTATPIITITEELALSTTPVVTTTAELTATMTPTVEATEVLTPTATPTIIPTATPYTEEGYKSAYENIVKAYAGYNISEDGLRNVIRAQLFRDRVKDQVMSEMDIPRTQEEVWARHILVADEQTAIDIKTRLDAGEDFCKIAAELSTDESNKNNCGDLGWFPRGQMVAPFEDAAFSLAEGEISEGIQTDFGWHIIWVLGHDERPITDDAYEQLLDTKFSEWLQSLRDASEVKINDFWQSIVPSDPELPAEIEQFIQQYQQSNLPVQSLDATTTPAP
jgi:peptidyl-prolyl cis-trans isomerase D